MKYINQKAITELINSKGKRAGKDFLFHLNTFIQQKVEKACEVHNGGAKTLDSSIAEYVGIHVK